MEHNVREMFSDAALVQKIQRRLPHLFHYAERDSSRAGKVGMEVGSLRERILISLLMYRFGRQNVESDLPITTHELDVKVYGEAVSIKTITTKQPKICGIKVIWTADAYQGLQFVHHFFPTCDYLVTHIVWGHYGGLYFIPCEAQSQVMNSIGRDEYLKAPRPGTNERGVQVTARSMTALLHHQQTLTIPIAWQRPEGTYDQYERWVEYWRLD